MCHFFICDFNYIPHNVNTIVDSKNTSSWKRLTRITECNPLLLTGLCKLNLTKRIVQTFLKLSGLLPWPLPGVGGPFQDHPVSAFPNVHSELLHSQLSISLWSPAVERSAALPLRWGIKRFQPLFVSLAFPPLSAWVQGFALQSVTNWAFPQETQRV